MTSPQSQGKLSSIRERVTRQRFGSRPGPKPDVNCNRKIADIVGLCDPRWRDGSRLWRQKSSLKQICADLYIAKVRAPASWLEGRTLALSKIGLDARTWEEALNMGFHRLVIDQLRYHLGRCLRCDSPASRTK